MPCAPGPCWRVCTPAYRVSADAICVDERSRRARPTRPGYRVAPTRRSAKTARRCAPAAIGEVLLRNLQIEIVPMHVHEGDLTAQDAPLVTQQAVFVTGAVREQARIEADGEIYVHGEVRNAQVWSRDQAITVVGAVSGTAQEPSVLRAHGDILCGPVTHSRLTASGDIHLRGVARQSTLRAGGSVYLPDSLESSLLDVRLQIEGGLFPGQLSSTLPELADTRQHVRVSMRLRALLAVHHSPPLAFRTCTILNMSVSGARCQFPNRDHRLEPGMLVQLKFMLPDSRDYTLVVARVAREITEHVIGLEFLQITQRDQHHLTTYCLQLLLKRMHGQGSSRRSMARSGSCSHCEPARRLNSLSSFPPLGRRSE